MHNSDFSFGECKLALSKKIYEVQEETSSKKSNRRSPLKRAHIRFFFCEPILSYHRRPDPKKWLVVRRKGKSPIRVVAGERYRTKKKALKEARDWNKAYKGSDVRFMLRRQGWRRKIGHS